jgi:hypothetical protein
MSASAAYGERNHGASKRSHPIRNRIETHRAKHGYRPQESEPLAHNGLARHASIALSNLLWRYDMKKIGHRFSSVATMLLIVSSATSFAHDNRNNGYQDPAKSDEKAVVWHARGSNGNGCAVGNSPPPGTNC